MATAVQTRKAVRELKRLRTADRARKTASMFCGRCCRCCRCCRCW